MFGEKSRHQKEQDSIQHFYGKKYFPTKATKQNPKSRQNLKKTNKNEVKNSAVTHQRKMEKQGQKHKHKQKELTDLKEINKTHKRRIRWSHTGVKITHNW